MNCFSFEELPPAAATRGGSAPSRHHMEAAARLRESPGKWAVVKKPGTSLAARAAAHQIRSGSIVAYRPAGAYDAVARAVDGEFRVYARYIGDDAA
jgi:hypothetical protein